MTENPTEKFFIVGGAGFIGGHFVDYLLNNNRASAVTIFDNFSSGREWHHESHKDDPRFTVVRGEIKDLELLTSSMSGHDVVIHLASNPDIAKAATEPDVDFWEGTYLTQNVLEAMRLSGTNRILYASGSGIYGDLGTVEAQEDHGPLIPISTYGASKLAGETLISSYCHMFGLSGRAFRFGNVVGGRQTHGVGYDFLKKLLKEPGSLGILGDGSQSKSYIYIEDIINAVLTAHTKDDSKFNVFNVATGDYITVKEIADITLKVLELDPNKVEYKFAGGDRGWKGDVPIIRLNTNRIQGLGWSCQKNCRQAIEASLTAMKADIQSGRI